MPANFNADKLNFKRVRINKEKTLEVTIDIGSDEDTYTIIAPDGYYIVDPETGNPVKQLVVEGGSYLVTNNDEIIITNDDNNILVNTTFGTYVLKDDGGYILTDESLKIAYVE